jgi:hypothetical protein
MAQAAKNLLKPTYAIAPGAPLGQSQFQSSPAPPEQSQGQPGMQQMVQVAAEQLAAEQARRRMRDVERQQRLEQIAQFSPQQGTTRIGPMP